jgi:DNA polymerase iota
VGFQFDARTVVGKTYPPLTGPESFGFVSGSGDQSLLVRLILGSHLSQHMRHAMDEQKGYTATVGISTSKLLSKLVGNCNKPNHQTTLLPPYRSSGDTLGPETNVFRFISDHDIGGLPGIGFSLSQKLRSHVLHRAASSEDGLIYGRSKEKMTVRDMRESPNMSPQLLDKILGGPGAQQGIGGKIWGLLSGVDDTEVAQARNVPRQISIEDSYIRLDTLDQVYKELNMLAASLLKRMQMDLLEDDDDEEESREDQNTATGNRLNITASGNKRWMAHPRVIRLTTRPRKASNPDGTRARSFARISRSGPLPLFIFNLSASIDVTARKLVDECLLSLFKSLHPEKSGWNLSLVNVGVTNMEEGISSATGERDISKMFKRQDEFLRDWKVEDRDIPPDGDAARPEDLDIEDHTAGGQTFSRRDDHVDSEDFSFSTPQSSTAELDMEWDEEDGEQDCCSTCGAVLPGFAMAAHERYHAMEE